LLSLLSILYFLGVEVLEVLFGVEQGWETNHGINYQLINSHGVTDHGWETSEGVLEGIDCEHVVKLLPNPLIGSASTKN
jgi:hypothetical protein